MAEPLPADNETLVDSAEDHSEREKTVGFSERDEKPGAGKVQVVVKPPRTDVFREDEKLREHWYQLWRFARPAPPPPASFEESPMLQLAYCNIWTYMSFGWCYDVMKIGYQRPLQPTDLRKVDPARESSLLSDNLDKSWVRRVASAKTYNTSLGDGTITLPLRYRVQWALYSEEKRAEREKIWRTTWGRKKARLYLAIVEQFRGYYFPAVPFKILGDTCQLMTPLLAKAIIVYSEDKAAAKADGTSGPGIGKGIGMAFGMYLLTVCWSVNQHQVWWRGMTTGVLMRAALSCSVFKRAIVLSNESRAVFSNGKLMNHLSTDISRIDYCAIWFPSIPSAPFQLAICTILLCLQIGPSALAGIAFFAVIIPIQAWTMQALLRVRLKSMEYTDSRSKILQELLGAMRVMKYFTFEQAYADKIDELRKNELKGIRTLLMIRAMNTAVAFSLPVLSAVIAFCCYIGIGHTLDSAKIFTALSLFQLLRQPLMLLPTAFSAATDAWNACERLTKLYEAQTMDTTLNIDPSQKFAIAVRNVSLEWVTKAEEPVKTKSRSKNKHSKSQLDSEKRLDSDELDRSEPFKIHNLDMAIPRGQLTAICGPVGSGKSSLLQGLIGEMRKVHGDISFSGRVAYCPQGAWIQNASVRDNVLFGQPYDEKKYWKVIDQACLTADYEMLPDGDLTEIGEKGINLSGGQKQRVNIARALYFDADIVLFDDPLSAVDAHVGKSLFQNAIVDGLRARGKTVILVTHALHFLADVDYIYTIQDGSIVQQGCFTDLMASEGPFAALMHEFGGIAEEEEEEAAAEEEEAIEEIIVEGKPPMKRRLTKDEREARKAAGTGKVEGKLIVQEKRDVGSIKSSVYASYSKAGRGIILLPSIIMLCILMQGAQSMSSYWIVWWQKDHWKQESSFYMAIFAALGISQAILTLCLGFAMAFFNYFASRNLHKQAVHRIFYAPMSFFDTVPLGRIMGVFGRDFDVIDNTLPESLRNVIITVANVVGSIILITVFENYFIIIAVVVCFGYRYLQRFYQKSGRELKRLDSMFRGLLYGHFSESLSGLSTIRAYGEAPRFLRENEYRMDLENRAYIVYVATQRWLAIRLDMCGAILILAIALLVSIGPSTVSPAQVGLLLTYTVSLVQMFGMLTRQSAEVENNLNGAERITHYTGEGLAQEAPYEIPSAKPPSSWPDKGGIEMKDVVLSYRPGLPPVLKGITLNIHGGEKIGVVGRTGAGKSSIMSALFRLVELSSGSILLDGVDISKIGLKDLRQSMVIIPQDPLLFSGTLRSNLDPFSVYPDHKLWDALRRSHLVESDHDEKHVAQRDHEDKFTLEMEIEEEGNNLSVGQRSLVSLARALLRDEARVVVLDEATAAVDLETDGKIQQTIRTELAHKTLLCIAHRLRTIIFYDRILVMDAGRVAEFDTPINLFNDETSIFHQMCVKSSITADEIARANNE